MWELKTARDLTPGRIYVVKGDFLASVRKINAALNLVGDEVIFTAQARFTRVPTDIPVTLAADTPVYILKCMCNGMSFIANRWAYTGECSCVHHALPKES